MAANLNIVPHAYGRGHDDMDEVRHPLKGQIVLVSDATGMFDLEFKGTVIQADTAHELHLASLQGEFCDVESTDEVLLHLERS